MFTLTSLRTRLRLFVIPMLAVGGLAMSAQQAWACEVTGRDGKSRPCTFTERLGKCLEDSTDSYLMCIEAGQGKALCATARFADDAACVAGSFAGILLAAVRA